MVEFKDKSGQPVSLSTNMANVSADVTSNHDLALTEWDRVKPDLGLMDQGIAVSSPVVDGDAVALSQSFQSPEQSVPEKTWLENWDDTKPDLGKMSVPQIVEDEPSF
ncbi:MAG: hypothetical protein ACRBB3_08175 [Alphaproteobacteria bacterium]